MLNIDTLRSLADIAIDWDLLGGLMLGNRPTGIRRRQMRIIE